MHLINSSLKKSAAIAAAGALMFSLLVSGGNVMAAPPLVPVVTFPADGTATSSSPIAVSGTAEAGVEVRVSGGATPAAGTADASGNWTALVNLNLDAVNVLEFSARNTTTGEVSSSTSITITHSSATTTPDVTPPDAPIITSPTSPHSTTTNPITVTGTAEADSTVSVTGGSANASTTASAGGAWSLEVMLNNSSTNTLLFRATDAAGNTSLPTSLIVMHTGTSTGTTTPDVIPPDAPIITSPTSPHSTTTNPITVTGTAEASSTVSVIGGSSAASTTVSGAGNFSILVPLNSSSTNTLLFRATDAAGNTSAPTTLIVTHSGTTTATTTATSSPVITLIGDAGMTVFLCNINQTGFIDPGATAVTSSGATTTVNVSGFVSATTTGTFILTYTATADGFTTTTTRTVVVLPCSSGGGGGGGGGSAGDSNGGGTSGDNQNIPPFIGVTPPVSGVLPVVVTGIPTTQVLGASFVPGLPATGGGEEAFKFFLPILLSFGVILLGLSLKRKQTHLS